MHLFVESVEQDQTAHTCSLISLCTIRCSIMNMPTKPHQNPLNQKKFVNVDVSNLTSINWVLSKHIIIEGERAISPFPQCFLTIWKTVCQFYIKFEIVVCKVFQFGRV